MSDNDYKISVSASGAARFLVILMAIIVFLSSVGQLVVYLTGHNYVYGLIELFYIDDEGNIPTFFSASLLLFSSLLLGIIATFKIKSGAPYKYHWALLGFVLLYLAIDEASYIHELFYRPMGDLLGNEIQESMLAIWVIPGIVFVAVLGMTFVKFWLHLDPRTKKFFLLSAVIYFGGAIGVESLGSVYLEVFSEAVFAEMPVENLIYCLMATIEETMEMGGVIMLIYSLLDYMGKNYGEVAVDLRG